MPDIEELDFAAIVRALPDLTEILHVSVLAGASVGFVLPFTPEAAGAFWRGLLPAFRAGDRRLLVARRGGRIAGTVQLNLAMPPNGRHRGEINKLLVHPGHRRHGLAQALMVAAEALARSCGRRLLVLDTIDCSPAEALYRGLGFESAGVIPLYACSTGGVLEATNVMYKLLPES